MRLIKTSYDHPPIPIRSADYSAWIDGMEECGPYGHGATEKEAVSDLLKWQPFYDDENEERDEFLVHTVRECMSLGESWDHDSALKHAKEQWEKGERL